MLRLRPTSEEMLREAKTRRLKIQPERKRRTQQGVLLDDVDFADLDLGKYDKKTIRMNKNPEKGTQTDMFNNPSSTESGSAKSAIEPIREEQQVEKEYSRQTSNRTSAKS